MERRDLLGGLALGPLVAGLAGAHPAEANWGMVAPGPVPPPGFDGRLLVNRPRAYEIMEREGLDGIVALNPVNVFYLGNYFSYELQKLRAIPSFAVMARDPAKPIFLVVAGTDLEFIAARDREYPEVIPYTFPSDWAPYADKATWGKEPAASELPKARHPESLTARERQWADLAARVNPRRAATPEWALVRALEELGLTKGKVAVDDMRVADILKTLERPTVCLPGDNTFRKIRMIKSEVELKHMRTVARINQDACLAMLKQVKNGTTKAEVDATFGLEAAKRGAKAMWIASGSIGGFPDGVATAGRAMMVDAVCQYNFYHGDFGRTFCIGEPSKEILERARILKVGRDAAFAAIKPGMKYSELRKTVSDAMQKSYRGGSKVQFGVGPHSVGLQHTDQPYRDGLPFVVPDDLTFEVGMTLTVDLPTPEIGWGAIHFEDLIQVTKTGVEPLATLSDPLIVL
jgi:Xaa-Pro aminopeptidase